MRSESRSDGALGTRPAQANSRRFANRSPCLLLVKSARPPFGPLLRLARLRPAKHVRNRFPQLFVDAAFDRLDAQLSPAAVTRTVRAPRGIGRVVSSTR